MSWRCSVMNMNLKNAILIFTILLVIGCENKKQTAEEIMNKTIQMHGGELYENSTIDFDFRGRHYKLVRDQGQFAYHRIFSDSSDTYHDVLRNSSFERTVNDSLVSLDDDWIRRYSNSVNSVAYFALLPFGLNDPAVNKQLLPEEEIGGHWYFKVKVTFDKDGGGEDFEDVFVYWINKETFFMEYFGYSYTTDGGGIRFREAINPRKVGGIFFSDYINYKADDTDIDVESLAMKQQIGDLEKLSEIILENLEVTRIN